MSIRATYKPAADPRPILVIDFHKGTITRYCRVLFAGVGERYMQTQKWMMEIEGGGPWRRTAHFGDIGLEEVRETGEFN